MRRGKCKRVLGEGLRRKIVRHKLGFFSVIMEETASVKGQLLIRSIIEEYRNLLEVLADPQLLLTDSNNSKHLDPTDAHDSKKTTQEILQKLTRLFSQLKSVYNQCLEQIKRFDGSKPLDAFQSERAMASETKDLNEDTLQTADTSKLMQDVKDKNSQLKNVISEMRQLIWDIDIMKRS